MKTDFKHPAFSREVSFFDSVRDQKPKERMTLAGILEQIRSRVWEASITALRNMIPARYKEAKAKLPAFMMSGVCLTRDSKIDLDKKFLAHTGVLQGDFDNKDNPQVDSLKEYIDLLAKDPHVLFVFVSPSGTGIKAGILVNIDPNGPIEDVLSRHRSAFESIQAYFLGKYGLQMDKAVRDPMRMCFISSDADLRINNAATAMVIPVPSTTTPIPATVSATGVVSVGGTMEDDIRELLSHIPPKPRYDDWIRIASSVWSVLPKADGCRVLEEWSPEWETGGYPAKWRNRLNRIFIGTLVYYAKQRGFDTKTAALRKQWLGRVRFMASSKEGPEASLALVDHPNASLSPEFLMECLGREQRGDVDLWAACVEGVKLYDHIVNEWRSYRNGVWDVDIEKQSVIECMDTVTEGYEKLLTSVAAEIASSPAPDPKEDPRRELIKKIERRLKNLRSDRYIAGVLKIARSSLSGKETDFDLFPNLLCLENGVFDFDTGVFREHNPGDKLTKRTRIAFDPKAECPKWMAFLHHVLSGDTDLIDFLARVVGYSLTGYVDHDKMMFLYGTGANGKSVFTSVLKMLGGDFTTTASINTFLSRSTDNATDYRKAALRGARMVITDEIPSGRCLNESVVKSLIGGDQIAARNPHEKCCTFSPTHKVWCAGNHKPDIKDTDEGTWRRICLIPWLVSIPEADRRPRHELLAEFRAELPGILNWAIKGYEDQQKNGGLRPPASVVKATQEYRDDNDSLTRFLEEETWTSPGRTTRLTGVLEKYKEWCAENGEEPGYGSARKLAGVLRNNYNLRVEKGGDGGYSRIHDLVLQDPAEDLATRKDWSIGMDSDWISSENEE